ncbi:cytochrome c [Motiliproteus sp. SC1-56]|uniref:c-type cytochrome n=1 Tax=Motiliproteus sp. SC1-56 TaxID=2799565 RepID=UPI001A8DDE40|nr:cytochrome c [Motiliproteus sp. SC1-56]
MKVQLSRYFGSFLLGWGLFFQPPLLWAEQELAGESESRHEAGRALYNYRCYYCHGYSGDAKTLAATYMDPMPVDFTAASPDELTRSRMIKAVTDGVPGTGMKSFTHYLNADEIATVVDFVRREFMVEGRVNTRYHTPENGWPNHERYRIAFPFATGELALDAPQERLSELQRKGLRLFVTSCISCHDRSRVEDEGPIWELRAISYPRNNFSYSQFDGVTSASVYVKHDTPKALEGLTTEEREGEVLFQDNCAFCHGADGTGKNWIGSFLDQHPRDLTDERFMEAVDRERLAQVIRDGVKDTSMPAWKDVLSDAQIQAIISYISRAFHPVKPAS